MNNKRNGIGKEYDKYGNVKFEGLYVNNKKWTGKGNNYTLENGKEFVKYYNNKGNLLFIGEYENGERNGKGKEYIKGKLAFEGEYLSGKRWIGTGHSLINNAIYTLNIKNGYRKEYDYNGKLIFEGEYIKCNKKWKRERI